MNCLFLPLPAFSLLPLYITNLRVYHFDPKMRNLASDSEKRGGGGHGGCVSQNLNIHKKKLGPIAYPIHRLIIFLFE